jgi:hypothetical protein
LSKVEEVVLYRFSIEPDEMRVLRKALQVLRGSSVPGEFNYETANDLLISLPNPDDDRVAF